MGTTAPGEMVTVLEVVALGVISLDTEGVTVIVWMVTMGLRQVSDKVEWPPKRYLDLTQRSGALRGLLLSLERSMRLVAQRGA